ncbi:hypothetical protein SLS54_004803 [Diplodia seriata]
MAAPTVLDSAIAKSSQLSKIIWASSSTTHVAVKQLVSHSARLSRALVCLRTLPAAHHVNSAAVEACDRKLDECAGFIDECISFRRDSVLTQDDVDRNAFPAGRALLLGGELLLLHRDRYDYPRGVDVRGRYQLKRKSEVSRNRAPAHYSPEIGGQATPSIQPSSLGSTCSPSIFSASPSLQQSSMTSFTSSRRAPREPSPIHKKLPSLSLGPASLPAHVAALRLYTKENSSLPRDIQLLSWRKSTHPDGSVITWAIQGSDQEFVHYLPHNAFPLTLHKDHGEGSVVQFSTLHKVALRSENSERFFSSTRVVYEFVQNEPFMCFQEDIRHKHLVDVFNFHLILSNRSGSSTYGEAIHGHVKFWRDRDPPFHHSISFFGNHAGRDLEFPVLRFNAQTVPRRLEKRVKLSFAFPPKGGQSKGSFRGFFRRSQTSEASTPVLDHLPNVLQPTPQQAALMIDMKYLDLRFDTVEDFDRFIKSFQEIRAADDARSTFSLADISTELENASVADSPNMSDQNTKDPRKRLILCCDGSWQVSDRHRDNASALSNIGKLSRMIHPESEGKHPIPQVVYYQSGVGTTTHGPLDIALSGGLGFGLEDNVLSAYHYLSTNYHPADHLHAADEIFVFGFSRGAFTARALAGLVTELGLIRPAYLEEFRRAYRLYREIGNMAGRKNLGNIKFIDKVKALGGLLKQEDHQFISDLHRDANEEGRRRGKMYPRVRIKVVGVGALGIPDSLVSKALPMINGYFKFHDAALNSRIDNAFQALALDEHRGAFTPTLWYLDEKFMEGKKAPNLKQCWFPGFHESIGGGDTQYNHLLTKILPDSEMHDITLAWMCDQVDGLLHFDKEACRKILLKEDTDRVNWATAYEVDMMNVLQFFNLGIMGGSRTRTPGMYHVNNRQWASRTNETLHPSVQYRVEATKRGWLPYDPPALGGRWGLNLQLLPQLGVPRWHWNESPDGNGAVWVRPAVPALWPFHAREEPRRELSEWVIREVHGRHNFEASLLPPKLKQRLLRRNKKLIAEAAVYGPTAAPTTTTTVDGDKSMVNEQQQQQQPENDGRLQFWTRTTWQGPKGEHHHPHEGDQIWDKVGGKLGPKWMVESLMAAKGVGEKGREALGEVVVHAGVKEAMRHGHVREEEVWGVADHHHLRAAHVHGVAEEGAERDQRDQRENAHGKGTGKKNKGGKMNNGSNGVHKLPADQGMDEAFDPMMNGGEVQRA